MKIGHARVLADASDMTEEDWKSLRHKSVGSSDTAPLLGMGRYGSPLEVWETKTGRHTKDMNFAMSLGHVMEPIILDLAADELGMTIEKPDLVLQHPSIPEMTCNLDGYATNVYGETAIVEAKHAGNYLKGELRRWADSGKPDEDSATEAWWVQVQFQLMICNMRQGYLAALCDKEFFVIPVSYDVSFQDTMLDILPGWHKVHIENGIEPALGGRDSDVVTRLFPKGHSDEVVDMDPVLDDVVMARDFKRQIKELKKELAEHDVRIKAHLGEGGVGVSDGEKIISSYTVERKSVDYHKLFMEYPEVYKEVVSTSVSRMYRY